MFSMDVTITGDAAMRVVGYRSNPHIRDRTNADVPIYDAKMTLELKDVHGQSLWCANIKPRFWGSQYISDNLTKQAAKQITETHHGEGN